MWAQSANMALGIWLMAAPTVLGYGNPARTNDWIVGPLVATFACIAMWEATRGVRWWNVPLASWMMAAPIALDYPPVPSAHSILIGVFVVAMSCMRGHPQRTFGGGWRSLWQPSKLARFPD